MASKAPLEAIPLRNLQRFHHATLNTFGDGETLVEAIQRRPGVYGPNPIAYLSLMARRPSLTLGDLDEALMNDRSLVRAGAFRTSVFLIATEDFPLYFRAMYEPLMGSGMSRLRSSGYDEVALQVFARRLHESAEFDRPMAQNKLANLIFPPKTKRPDTDVERLIFRKLCDLGVLVRTSSKGWKGNQFNYALVERWLDGVVLSHEHPEPTRAEVVRRYLRAYGPARIEDAVWWTGFAHSELRQVIEGFGREVVRFPVDGLGEGLLALRETVDAIRKSPLSAPSKILFLPLWDMFPLGWRDRTRVVDPSFAPWIYDPAGNATSIIVEDGRAIGIWQFRDGDDITLEFHLFEPYMNRLNALRLAAEEHATTLATVAGARDIRVIERALPRPLSERPAASFLWPLGKEPVLRTTDTLLMESPMDRRTTNVLRSRFLDDERLVRPAEVEPSGRVVPRDAAYEELETEVSLERTRATKHGATRKTVEERAASSIPKPNTKPATPRNAAATQAPSKGKATASSTKSAPAKKSASSTKTPAPKSAAAKKSTSAKKAPAAKKTASSRKTVAAKNPASSTKAGVKKPAAGKRPAPAKTVAVATKKKAKKASRR